MSKLIGRFGLLLVMLVLLISAGVMGDESRDFMREIKDIAVQSDGSILVLDASHDEVVKMDKDGKLLWYTSLKLDSGRNSNSYALVPWREDPRNVLVVSEHNLVRRLSPTGELTTVFPDFGLPTGSELAVGGDLLFYHPNSKDNCVDIWAPHVDESEFDAKRSSADMEEVKKHDPCIAHQGASLLGGESYPTFFHRPRCVSVDYLSGRMWVCDETNTYKVFASNGEYLFQVEAPDAEKRAFYYIEGMEFDANGCTYMASAELKGVLKFNKSGRHLWTTVIGEGYMDGFGLGPDGNYYLGDNDGVPPLTAELGHAKIKVFNQVGKLLRTIVIPDTW